MSEGKTQTREWGLTEEIQRLDQLAGIVLQAALAVVALATGVLITVSDSDFQILAALVAFVCGLAGVFAAMALRHSPLDNAEAARKEKDGQVKLMLYLLIASIYLGGIAAVVLAF